MEQLKNEENNDFEGALERFRPVLVTIAEAMISPAYRGDIEASDLVQQTLLEAHTAREFSILWTKDRFSVGYGKHSKTTCSTLSNI